MSAQSQSFPGAFCEPCNKWRAPNAVLADGSCPRCGSVLDMVGEGEALARTDAELVPEDGPAADQTIKIPWHFWVMVAATVGYLGWRVIQGVGQLF